MLIDLSNVDSLCSHSDRNHDNLDFGDPGRNDETATISVGKNHDTNGASGQTPRILPNVHMLRLSIFLGNGILHGDVEHFGEVLAKAMRSGCLNSTS